jgi:hypothetical protein
MVLVGMNMRLTTQHRLRAGPLWSGFFRCAGATHPSALARNREEAVPTSPGKPATTSVPRMRAVSANFAILAKFADAICWSRLSINFHMQPEDDRTLATAAGRRQPPAEHNRIRHAFTPSDAAMTASFHHYRAANRSAQINTQLLHLRSDSRCRPVACVERHRDVVI